MPASTFNIMQLNATATLFRDFCNNLTRNSSSFLTPCLLSLSQPEKFDPDRFLTSEVKKRPSFSYMPFSQGPRQCIGMRLALLEIKMALVKILQKFKFERGVGTTDTLDLHAELILRPREQVRVKVVRVKEQ